MTNLPHPLHIVIAHIHQHERFHQKMLVQYGILSAQLLGQQIQMSFWLPLEGRRGYKIECPSETEPTCTIYLTHDDVLAYINGTLYHFQKVYCYQMMSEV